MWIQAPDGTWTEFDDNATDADIAEAMKTIQPAAPVAPANPAYSTPEQPRLNIPATAPSEPAWMQDPRAQAEAASAVQAVSPAPPPAGTVGEKRGSILPISRPYVVDDKGQPQFTGEINPAVPGMLADVPQQVNTLGSHWAGDPYTDEDISSMLGLAGFGVGKSVVADAAAKGPLGWDTAKSVLSSGPRAAKGGIADELASNIKTEMARNTGKAKAQIVRDEALKITQKYGDKMKPSDIQAVTEIYQRGAGPVRSRVERVAGAPLSKMGFDPGNLAATSLTASALPKLSGAYMGLRMAYGAATNAGILAAKAARRAMTNQDIRDLNKVIPYKGKATTSSAAKVEATRKAFESQGTAPRTGRPPTAEEAAATTPKPYTPPTQPSGPISLARNASSPIQMEIGERSVKGKGSLAPKEEPPVKTPKIESRVAQPAETVTTPKEPRSVISKPTSPTLSVKLRPEEQAAMDKYLAEGGTVTKPAPKPVKTGIVVTPKEPRAVKPKSIVSAPKKTGRPPTAKEAVETTPQSESWLPDPKAFSKGPVPEAAIVKPKSIISEARTTPKEPRVAKKAAAREARKADKTKDPRAIEAAQEANKEKMREIMLKKAKRGVGSY
jgi:hypothetical protein